MPEVARTGQQPDLETRQPGDDDDQIEALKALVAEGRVIMAMSLVTLAIPVAAAGFAYRMARRTLRDR